MHFLQGLHEKKEEKSSYQKRETQHGCNDFSNLLSGVFFFFLGGGGGGLGEKSDAVQRKREEGPTDHRL